MYFMVFFIIFCSEGNSAEISTDTKADSWSRALICLYFKAIPFWNWFSHPEPNLNIKGTETQGSLRDLSHKHLP